MIPAAAWWLLLAISVNKDRSRYRNCYLLFFALATTALGLTFFTGDHQDEVLYVMFLLTLIALLIVPFVLIANGVLMIKREGRSLANLLSLVFGIVIAFGEIAAFIYAARDFFFKSEMIGERAYADINLVSAVISVSVIYISISFLVFMFYCVFLMIIPRKRDFDYVIIHGAGLLDGDKVSKLLADRLDKAIEIYRKDPTPPVLIPSGGKGSDETVSEARAMADYLIEKGIPEDRIMLEDGSTNTLQNLENSKALIDKAGGGRYIALVTSNYHVYRALRYCRKIGLKCTGIGSHVALYYWPSALIREYIAIRMEFKHLVLFLIGWALCVSICFLN